MKCRDTKGAVKSLVCGEKADVEAIERHFSECRRCREIYEPVLAIVTSAKDIDVPAPGDEAWKELSARLRRRIVQEQPKPIGRLGSFLLWVGESSLLRVRKSLAFSAATVLLAISLVAFFLRSSPDYPRPQTIVAKPPIETPMLASDLPPELADVLSIFGRDGFVYGVFLGYIQPGDFLAGHELNQDRIIEALDYLLS